MKKYLLVISLGIFVASASSAYAKTLDQIILEVKTAQQQAMLGGAVLGASSTGSASAETGGVEVPTEKTQYLIEDLRNISGKPIGEIVAKTIRLGETNDDVKALQTFLMMKAYLNIDSPTGYYGTMTRDAVKRFQMSRGIDGDGTVVGPKTKEALTSVY